jgi:hypothetical protein
MIHLFSVSIFARDTWTWGIRRVAAVCYNAGKSALGAELPSKHLHHLPFTAYPSNQHISTLLRLIRLTATRFGARCGVAGCEGG